MKMMSFARIITAVVLSLGSASGTLLGASIAQAQNQHRHTLQAWVPPVACYFIASPVSNYQSGNHVFYLENYAEGILPANGVEITSAAVWWDSVAPIDGNSSGNVFITLDERRTHQTLAGFPQFQRYWPQYMSPLVVFEPQPDGKRYIKDTAEVPALYKAGVDGLQISPECAPLAGWLGTSMMAVSIMFQSTTDFQALAIPPLSVRPATYGHIQSSTRHVATHGCAWSGERGEYLPRPARALARLHRLVDADCRICVPAKHD